MWKLILAIFIGCISVDSYALDSKSIVIHSESKFNKPYNEIRISFMQQDEMRQTISFHNIQLNQIIVLKGKKLKINETISPVDSGGPLLKFISLVDDHTLLYKKIKIEYINKKLFINGKESLNGAIVYNNGKFESLIRTYHDN